MPKPKIGSIARFRMDIKKRSKKTLKKDIKYASGFGKRFGHTASSKKTLHAMKKELKKR